MQERSLWAMYGLEKPDAYNPYAAGPKMYGASGRSNPTSGPIDRTAKANAQRNALLRRLQAEQQKKFADPAYLRGQAARGY